MGEDPEATLPPNAGRDLSGETMLVSADRGSTAAGPSVSSPPGYRLVRELGRGGMGVVYLARQISLNRDVALKMVLSGGHASDSERQRFIAEAEAAASIQHPGVAQIYEYGTHEGQPFFALEYCPGDSLATILGGNPLPPNDACRRLIPIARAVQAAHQVGIIHRDLKPANILLAADGSPKVTDFGLARRSEGGSGLTQTGAILGTPSYMAPEQAMGQPDQIGPATDVYALGAILYEALVGRPPFRAATPFDTVLQVSTEEPVAPSKLVRLPRDVETVCLKCLHKDPRRRYGSAAEFADDLERCLAGEPIRARPVPVWERAWKAVRRRPTLSLAMVVAAAAIAAIVVIVLQKNAELRRGSELALKAEARADKEKEKAKAHLEIALNAVEKMLARVSSGPWLTRPELQPERKQALDDALEVYRSFLAEETNDPKVRAEAARAYHRIAQAYLPFAMYDKAQEAIEAALTLQEGLIADHPEDLDRKLQRAQMIGTLANVLVLRGKMDEAGPKYEQAVDVAREVYNARPTHEPTLQTLVESLTSLGLFRRGVSPQAAAQTLTEAVSLASQLNDKPNRTFEQRLVLANALANRGTIDMMMQQPQQANDKLAKARMILEGLDPADAPSFRYREVMTYSQATLNSATGTIRFNAAQSSEERAKAIVEIRKSIEGLDQMMRLHPKSFPTRIQKSSATGTLARALEANGQLTEAREAYQDFVGQLNDIIRENPRMNALRGSRLMAETSLLSLNVRLGKIDDVESIAEKLANDNSKLLIGDVKYNIACALSLASGRSEKPADRQRYSAKALSQLEELLAANYFDLPRRAIHLRKDADLDPLRSQDRFRKLLDATLEATKKKE